MPVKGDEAGGRAHERKLKGYFSYRGTGVRYATAARASLTPVWSGYSRVDADEHDIYV
jgi:hypothetical protein